jgi:hypothetical protein
MHVCIILSYLVSSCWLSSSCTLHCTIVLPWRLCCLGLRIQFSTVICSSVRPDRTLAHPIQGLETSSSCSRLQLCKCYNRTKRHNPKGHRCPGPQRHTNLPQCRVGHLQALLRIRILFVVIVIGPKTAFRFVFHTLTMSNQTF